jgi:outer membrane protein assembly factor BamB
LRIIRSIPRHISTAISVIAMTIALAVPASAWQTAHGDPDNTGAVDVRTARAVSPRATVPGLGGIAPGAAPVIAADGTLYLGNARGKLMSFGPDGTPGWSRDIGGFQSILASPAIGSDGAVYVIGAAVVRDHTVSPATTKSVVELHKFTAGGGWLWHRPLPGLDVRTVAIAPPNILRMGGSDVVIVPSGNSDSTFLTAISGDNGAVLAHQLVTRQPPPTVTGGASYEDILCEIVQIGGACGFSLTLPGSPQQDRLPKGLKKPFPAAAVFSPAGGGAPLVHVSDGFHDLVGYSFTGSAFEERFRVHDDQRFLSAAPLGWPDGHAMISIGGFNTPSQVMYAGLGLSTIRAAAPYTDAPPAALGGSRHALVRRGGGVTVMSGVTIVKNVALPGESIAAAAASRGHVFVSTASALHTFDKETMTQLSQFPWSNGGVSQPVIGPRGHVYAIAGDTLYVFAPPRVVSDGELPGGGTVPVLQSTGAPQPLPPPSSGMPADRTMPRLGSSPDIQQVETPAVDPQTMPELEQDLPTRTYKPPLTAGGNRLFACLELDGDNCGNSQMREVAENFCQAQGFIRAEDLDVDSRRGVAETLDGRLCSKKKCKVFDQIVCRK